MPDITASLTNLHNRSLGGDPAAIVPLRADGSNRRIYRLHDAAGRSVIGVYGPDPEENRAFLSFSAALADGGLPVPAILGADEEEGVYLQEDLGDTTLFDYLGRRRSESGEPFPADVRALYVEVLRILPRFQIEGARRVDFTLSRPRDRFDERAMRWDLDYFKYLFLKLVEAPFDEEALEDEFDRLVAFLAAAPCDVFLYRDFQSRNIMVQGPERRLRFIDYQGGRLGGPQYDVASLLYDAKAAIPHAERTALLEVYLDAFDEQAGVDAARRADFLRLYPGFVLIRALQAMGAYGYRGLYEGKPHFIASIPFGVANLRRTLTDDFPIALPELTRIITALDEQAERIAALSAQAPHAPIGPLLADAPASTTDAGATDATAASNPATTAMAASNTAASTTAPSTMSTPAVSTLRVRITSFSYKKGSYPVDESEHGGGFVFDCRAIENPGRQEAYRALTGRDREVVEFLEGRDDVEALWGSVTAIADMTIARYRERGFDALAISFGCTGGQHRSVYFAERLAAHVRAMFDGVAVEVAHREQGMGSRE